MPRKTATATVERTTNGKATKKDESPIESLISVVIPNVEVSAIRVTLAGDSPLIMHKWSEKAKRQMLDKQMKKASQGKTAKDPQADYESTIYYREDGSYGFPATGVKDSAISACRYIDGMERRMTFAKGSFHINEELVLIEGVPKPREDMVRNATTADIRYRAEFADWTATFDVVYNKRVISPDQIVNLFNIGGFGVGIGDWRPEKGGRFGRYHTEVGVAA